MKVTHFICGSMVNESERLALEHIKIKLQNLQGDSEWILLTNITFSVNHHLQSDEIDMIVIGPPGVRVIEVKHWSPQWMKSSTEAVEYEAEKVLQKAKKIGTTLRKTISNLPRVDGVILLTRNPSNYKNISLQPIHGVGLYTLNDWKTAINGNSQSVFQKPKIQLLGRTLEPKSIVAIDGSIRRLAGFVNLELQSKKDESFHRVYKGIHSVRQDRVIMHVYDLSSSNESKAEQYARREFDTLRHFQRYNWAPRILDSFQMVPGYGGEMFFFTIVDPAAPSVYERAKKDKMWSPNERIEFSRNTIRALLELHAVDEDGQEIIHRNITPHTILVKHNSTPIFTAYNFSKLQSDISIASTFNPSNEWNETAAPEVRSSGIGIADFRSDVFSLCKSLTVLFENQSDYISNSALDILNLGLFENPKDRSDLNKLDIELSSILGDSLLLPPPPPARFWTEDQEIEFHDYKYKIINKLGSGGIGATYKVVKLDQHTKEDLGTYVAKIVFSKENGAKALKAYNLAHSHLGNHPCLSTIFEVAKKWVENNFIALMKWIDGTPLNEFTGVFPLLSEDQNESNAESLAIRWLSSICDALDILHRNGLIHGDVSPKNMIVNGSDLVLTDYDFVGKINEPIKSPGTILYSSTSYQEQIPASPSDDIYALAASFFHVIFEKEPFKDKKQGLDWENIQHDDYPFLSEFFNRATNPDRDKRFLSALDVKKYLDKCNSKHNKLSEVCEEEKSETSAIDSTNQQNLEETIDLHEENVEWLLSLLQSYPGSRMGNQETRGLDSDFATKTYVETKLEQILINDIKERNIRLVILCGNAGDGKTALLQHIASKLGLGKHSSSERILEGKMEDGLVVRMNLDGSASWKERSADEILDEFLLPFQEGVPKEDIIHLLAINDGRLLEWIESKEESSLTNDLYCLLQDEEDEMNQNTHIRFISLNQRSLVGGLSRDNNRIDRNFLDRLLNQLYGGEKANEIWKPCLSCTAKNRCEVFRALKLFGPNDIQIKENEETRKRARERLFEALQAVHLRGEVHITMRELRASLVYILFGIHYCTDYHNEEKVEILPYWDRVFDPYSYRRQGEVLWELILYDPALEAHPQIDRRLMNESSPDSNTTIPFYDLKLESAKRRAFFEWTEDQIIEVTREAESLGLARGKHIRRFRDIPLMNDSERFEICINLCKGISRLEDLPPQALDRKNVPLRITPRTPIETAFWVEKPMDSFRLEADIPQVKTGLDILHRQVYLVFQYRNGQKEKLRLGEELFHLLLELSEGYQLGDVSTDDTFAHLSIFVQRLVSEDENELLSWNPMSENVIYKISTNIVTKEDEITQILSIHPIEEGNVR